MFGTALIAGALAGAASIPHCVGMCGPLAAFACSREKGSTSPLRYQLGRSVSYLLLGGVAGLLGATLSDRLSGGLGGAVLSWLMALALGLTALRLWRSSSPGGRSTPSLIRLRTARTVLDRFLALLPREPLAIGLLTGLLPCGALAAAVLIAAGSGSPLAGAGAMLAFAVASSPALVGASWLAGRSRAHPSPWRSRTLATCLALGALLLVLRPMPGWGAANGATAESCPLHTK